MVTLVPSITETLFALEVGDRIVGVTDFCVHPAEAVQAKTRVGGTKNHSLERIAELAGATLHIEPYPRPIRTGLLEKHFRRKHGPGRYYGQEEPGS